MDVVLYLRKSRAEELKDTTAETLRRHREQLEALAARCGYHIILTFEEVVSGESLYARPQMLAMLEAVSGGDYDAVLCMDIDRLGRGSMAEQGIIFDALRRSNTKIITPDKTYDLNNENDEEMTELYSFIARRELKIIKKRMRRGILKSVEDGAYLSNAPFGYQKAKIGRTCTIEPFEPEAQFVRMAFDLYANQNFGSVSVAKRLNALGAKPRRGEKFSRNSITYMLKNPVYIGKVVWNKQRYIQKDGKRKSIPTPENKQIIDGIHTPLIDEDTFNRANQILDKQWHKGYFDGTIKNPLAGIVACGNCGSKMLRHPSGRRTKVPFLACQNAGCIKTVRVEDAERAILGSITQQLRKIELSGVLDKAPDLSSFDKTISSAEAELRKIVSQNSQIHTFLETGVYDVETFLDRRRALEERTDILKALIRKQQQEKAEASAADLAAAAARIRSVLETYWSCDAPQRNTLLRSIVENITYFSTPAPTFSVSLKYFPTVSM